MTDTIERIMELYAGLSDFDKGRLFQAMKIADEAAEPAKRRPGRPTGSKSKPNGNPVDAAAQGG
jgi:hypothetical protein